MSLALNAQMSLLPPHYVFCYEVLAHFVETMDTYINLQQMVIRR